LYFWKYFSPAASLMLVRKFWRISSDRTALFSTSVTVASVVAYISCLLRLHYNYPLTLYTTIIYTHTIYTIYLPA